MLDLFADAEPWQEPLAAGAVILRRFAFNAAEQLIRDINDVASQSPFRQMVTPGGYTMSVAMTNCGIWAGRPIGKVISIRPLIRKQINRGPPCHRVFIIYVNVRLRRRAIQISSQMLVLSTATLLARNCRCIRIKTNRICARQLFLFLWAYPRFFNLAA